MGFDKVAGALALTGLLALAGCGGFVRGEAMLATTNSAETPAATVTRPAPAATAVTSPTREPADESVVTQASLVVRGQTVAGAEAEAAGGEELSEWGRAGEVRRGRGLEVPREGSGAFGQMGRRWAPECSRRSVQNARLPIA